MRIRTVSLTNDSHCWRQRKYAEPSDAKPRDLRTPHEFHLPPDRSPWLTSGRGFFYERTLRGNSRYTCRVNFRVKKAAHDGTRPPLDAF
jgi:hypothetical protein